MLRKRLGQIENIGLGSRQRKLIGMVKMPAGQRDEHHGQKQRGGGYLKNQRKTRRPIQRIGIVVATPAAKKMCKF